jgi:O-antigen/teichoic acid export membrane protein
VWPDGQDQRVVTRGGPESAGEVVDADPLSASQNMTKNSISLVLSSLLAGVLGLIFWGAAGRLYPAREVGVAAALITSAVMLSTISILSIDSIFERFLPVAGTRADAVVKRGMLVVATAALLSGVGLVIFGPRHELFGSRWEIALYPLFVMVLAVFALQDKATVGLGVARWAAAKNLFHAVVKLVAVFALAWTASGVSIVLAWGATAVVAVLFVLIAMRRRYRTHPQFQESPNLPSTRQLWSFFGSSFGITASWAVAPLVVPLIVVSQFGAEANAHFAVTWAIINALYTAVELVISPFVAEAAANPDNAASLSLRMVQMMAVVAIVGSVGLVVVGPYVLSIVGPAYREQGAGLLYLAGAFIPLSAVGAVYEGIARVRRRLTVMFVVRIVATIVIVYGSLILTRSHGVVGVGWAYLVAEAGSAIILLPPVVLWLRRARRDQATLARSVAVSEVV